MLIERLRGGDNGARRTPAAGRVFSPWLRQQWLLSGPFVARVGGVSSTSGRAPAVCKVELGGGPGHCPSVCAFLPPSVLDVRRTATTSRCCSRPFAGETPSFLLQPRAGHRLHADFSAGPDSSPAPHPAAGKREPSGEGRAPSMWLLHPRCWPVTCQWGDSRAWTQNCCPLLTCCSWP